jgi:hypothetical protein
MLYQIFDKLYNQINHIIKLGWEHDIKGFFF